MVKGQQPVGIITTPHTPRKAEHLTLAILDQVFNDHELISFYGNYTNYEYYLFIFHIRRL